MKHYIGFILFLTLLGSSISFTANVFGEEYIEDPLYAVSIDTDLEKLHSALHVLGAPFDHPIREEDISRIETVLSNPNLKESETYSLGDVEMLFNGEPTTLILEAEVEIKNGHPYFYIYMMGDLEIIEMLDEHIYNYYEELGI